MPAIIKNISIAVCIALAWVLLVTLAAFPDLFVKFEEFRLERCYFETTGRVIILIIAVYLFDVITEVVITPLSGALKVYFGGFLALVVAVLLILFFAVSFSTRSIIVILLIDVFMGIMKGICVFQTVVKFSSKSRFNNNVKLVKV